jgi:uncharacterized protein YjbI with pentapeptide repeats
MLKPTRAPVRPRIISPVSGESLLLEEELLSLVARTHREIVWLAGGAGSGKSTALAHLAAVLPPGTPVTFFDTGKSCAMPQSGLAVYAVDASDVPTNTHYVYTLAPWGDDELIEYLLGQHPEHCASVMSRCPAVSDKQMLCGNPELWRHVLDVLAADPGILTIKDALRSVIRALLPEAHARELAGSWSLAILCGKAELGARYRASLERVCEFRTVLRLLRHAPILLLLAAERIASELKARGLCELLQSHFARELVDEAAALIRDDRTALDHLENILAASHRWKSQPMAASLVHAAAVGWQPCRSAASRMRKWSRRQKFFLPNLSGAHLEGAVWPHIVLSRTNLNEANLRSSDLTEANLDDSDAADADLCGAKLRGASLTRLRANGAQLLDADLSYVRAANSNFSRVIARDASFEGALLTGALFDGAKLTGARFARANLSSARLVEADIEGADFSQANLNGAWLVRLVLRLAEFRQCHFRKAVLAECDLEGMSLPGADFHSANLNGALLTGSFMPGADFRGAQLVNTGLADIDWEQADLRDADLRGAAFHMGSSRSGLVDSTIASFGTRTGFYTDEYGEQDFKPPEEIRKANLRGADLRGANIEGVDFYLVDLRDALYDARQETQFRGCGAILESRVR